MRKAVTCPQGEYLSLYSITKFLGGMNFKPSTHGKNIPTCRETNSCSLIPSLFILSTNKHEK